MDGGELRLRAIGINRLGDGLGRQRPARPQHLQHRQFRVGDPDRFLDHDERPFQQAISTVPMSIGTVVAFCEHDRRCDGAAPVAANRFRRTHLGKQTAANVS